ncbi:MAG: sunset domain-containing protein [Acidimicrobiia bacterium]
MLKLLRRGALAGVLAGAAYGIWRYLASRSPDTGGVTFESSSFLTPPRPVPKLDAPGPPGTAVPTGGAAAPANAAPTNAAPTNGAPTSAASTGAPWVEPDDGSCPLSHPVKAKLSSGIYHLPGGGNYDRIRAERCYVDADAATADGLRPPKR